MEGDVQAFDQLFLEMYPALCLVATRLAVEEEPARDLASDIFLRLWENRASLTHVRDIRAYLYVAARNHSLNYLKKVKGTEIHHHQVAAELPQEPATDEVLQSIYHAETLRILKKAIDGLPDACRNVVMLSVEGYSSNEIAARLGISASAVSNQKARAVRLLKEQMPVSLLLVCFFFDA